MTTLAEGAIFAGRYRVVRCIAAGGMGAVYEAVHLETNRRRALKVMHPHLFQNDEMRERFKREARIAAEVESEFIVDVSDAGVDDATKMPFLVMELLRGEELGQRLKSVGRLHPEEVMTYLHQIALALDRTHASAIVHRDLKPENIFVTRREDGTPRIKILDFGVAKLVADGATGAGATRSLGTPLYMPPEQFRASSKLSPAADIYALGMLAYTLLVGEAYWTYEARSAGDVIAFAMIAVHGPKEPASVRAARLGVALPPSFDAWFAAVTAASPAERHPTAGEAVRALGAALAGMPAQGPLSAGPAHAPSSTPPAVPSLRLASTSTGAAATSARHADSGGTRGALVALVAVLGVSGLGVGAWLVHRSTTLKPHPASTTAEAASPVPTETAVSPPTAAPPVVAPTQVAAAESAMPSATAAATAVATASAATRPAPGPRPPSSPGKPRTGPQSKAPSAEPASPPASLFGRN